MESGNCLINGSKILDFWYLIKALDDIIDLMRADETSLPQDHCHFITKAKQISRNEAHITIALK